MTRRRFRVLAGLIGVLLAAALLLYDPWWRLYTRPIAQVSDPASTMFGYTGVLVCANSGSSGGSSPVMLELAPGAIILDQRGTLLPRPARREDLRRGQRVRFDMPGWQVGTLFSLPTQELVSAILIVADGPPEPLECKLPSLL